MDSRTFGAFTRADGKMAFDSRSSFDAYIASLPPGSRLTITVAPEQDVRSLEANARFWKICELAAEAMSVGRALPISKDEAKLALCRAFLGVVETPFGPVPKGTRHRCRRGLATSRGPRCPGFRLTSKATTPASDNRSL